MAKRLIRRYLPEPHRVRDHKYLRMFGLLLHDPGLWHLNRRSVAGAVANGLFWAFIPMPFQMIPAAALSILFRVNLPISVALVWITNPLTMAPVMYFCYKIGAWLLRAPPHSFTPSVSWEWLMAELGQVWQPLYLGSLVVAASAAALGYLGMRALWRWHVVRDWNRRRRVRTPSPR